MRDDHDRIWLEPEGAPDRCWCQDDVWEDGVEYIRADLVTKLVEAEHTRCANIAAHFMGSLWDREQNHIASLIFNEINDDK
jgi:hypothetical protein